MTIEVFGIPRPGGSKKAFVVCGRAKIVDTGKHTKDWRALVTAAAMNAIGGATPLITSSIAVSVMFRMPRPKSHYRKDGTIKESFRCAQHTHKPDATKLWRSTEDALTGIVWRDDAQIVSQLIDKRYVGDGQRVGAAIVVVVNPYG